MLDIIFYFLFSRLCVIMIFDFFAAGLTKPHKFNSLTLDSETRGACYMLVDVHTVIQPDVVNCTAQPAYCMIVGGVSHIKSVFAIGNRDSEKDSVVRHTSQYAEHRGASDFGVCVLQFPKYSGS